MSAETLLQKLDRVRQTGVGKWQACCPAHDDVGPSLAVRELDDGRVLIHCFAGCGAAEVLAAVGLDFAELYPPKISGDFVPRPRKPWNASDVLAAMVLEILVAWNYSKSLANGVALSAIDRDRLLLCATRMQRGLEAANGR
jgi:hypothetical protein